MSSFLMGLGPVAWMSIAALIGYLPVRYVAGRSPTRGRWQRIMLDWLAGMTLLGGVAVVLLWFGYGFAWPFAVGLSVPSMTLFLFNVVVLGVDLGVFRGKDLGSPDHQFFYGPLLRWILLASTFYVWLIILFWGAELSMDPWSTLRIFAGFVCAGVGAGLSFAAIHLPEERAKRVEECRV